MARRLASPRSHVGLLVIALAMGGAPQALPAPPANHLPRTIAHEQAADELLVKFRAGTPDAEADAVARDHGARDARRFKAPRKAAHAAIGRWWHVKLAPGQSAKQAMERLARHPLVEAVEPNYIVRALVTPNDPRFGELWGLQNIGQTGGAGDADIDAPEAWNTVTGSSAVVTAVIDTGVDYNHPDLAANMWTNPGEIPGNGIDDDGNGYVDDVHGYDFYNNDGNPFDDHGHGTHVAGTIAAVGDNGVGVAGVSWAARIMAVKFLGPDGSGFISGAISAVLYAADMGARVMNNSWGGGGFSQALQDAITAALEVDALFVAAAGNSASDNDAFPNYPSNYDVANVLAVAATDHLDAKASFSSYGAATVDLGAPGVNILSSVPSSGAACCSDPSGYRLLNGTSMATPHVSGAATLLLAQDPSRTAIGLKNLLMATADPIPALAGITVTGGRLNIANAVSCTQTQLKLSLLGPGPGFTAYLTETQAVRASVNTCGAPVTGAQVSVSFSNGEATLVLYDDGAHGDGAANDGVYANNWTPAVVGPITLTIDAAHPALGVDTKTASGVVRQRFSYRYEAVPFLWNDIVDGTRHALTGDSSVTIPIGFSFTFFGTAFSNVTISSNGFLAFNAAGATSFSNVPIPSTGSPNGIVAPFWDDLNPGVAGSVYSKLEGVAPNRRLTVSWVGVPHFTAGGAISFQAILREGSDDIIFQYKDVVFGTPGYDFGASATVGIENMEGTDGTQYSYNQPSLSDATAFRYYPGPYNHRPVANAGGPYKTLVGQPLTFNGSGSSDPDGDALTYRWDFGDGATGTGASPVHTYQAKGTYTVSLVVNDGYQDSAATGTTVAVPNQPPVAVLQGDTIGRRDFVANFNASASFDPDGEVVEWYRWDFGDGSPPVTLRRFPTVQYLYPRLGTFTVTLVVNDNLVDSAPVTSTITIVNVPPTADAGPDMTVHPRDKVILSSRSLDRDGVIAALHWRQISGTPVTITDPDPDPRTGFAYFFAPNVKSTAALPLEFELRVTDNDGAPASDRVIITVVK
jgi:subtilisin family serine protease/PKD repeat protein